MNILVLGCLAEATGNATTARRIARHLGVAHDVTLVDSRALPDAATLRALVRRQATDLALGVHALLAGPFLRACGVPYGLVLGGTDLYEPTHELPMRQMALAVAGAELLVTFSPENRRRAEALWPNTGARMRCVRQSVEGEADPGYSIRAALGLGDREALFLLAAGLRRVKDPLHVIDAMAAWQRTNPRVHLALVGEPLEPDYAAHVEDRLRGIPRVHRLAALPRAQFLSAIRGADVVLNTSISEGMNGVILEAMCLGTPVIARRNAGNESLVTHRHTGMLYRRAEECVEAGKALVSSGPLRDRVIRGAKAAVLRAHSVDGERDAYLRLVDEIYPPQLCVGG